MRVILTERVQSLGNAGEVVNVSQGYARNFLIPGKKAVMADEGNKKWLENEKRKLAKKVAEEKNVAVELKSKIDGMTLDFERRVAGNGKLFGTISPMDLSKAFESKGLEVEKRWIAVGEPIKSLGQFEVNVKIVSGVEATFNVKVEMDPKQVQEIKAKESAAKKKKQVKENQLPQEPTQEAADSEITEESEA